MAKSKVSKPQQQNVKISVDDKFDESVGSDRVGAESTNHGGTALDGYSTKNGSAPLLFESTLGSISFPKEKQHKTSHKIIKETPL